MFPPALGSKFRISACFFTHRGGQPGILGIFFIACSLAAAGAQDLDVFPAPAHRTVDFTTEVRPLFEQHCYGCHGAAQQMGGLRLDRKEDALRGGNSGAVIVLGDSVNSKLVRAIVGVEGEPIDANGR